MDEQEQLPLVPNQHSISAETALPLVPNQHSNKTHLTRLIEQDIQEEGKKPAPNIYALYEQNIGQITIMIAEELKDAEAEFPAEWIAEAISIAVKNNTRKWSYARAILNRWKIDGFKSDTRPKKNGKSPPVNEPAGFAGIRAFLEDQTNGDQ